MAPASTPLPELYNGLEDKKMGTATIARRPSSRLRSSFASNDSGEGRPTLRSSFGKSSETRTSSRLRSSFEKDKSPKNHRKSRLDLLLESNSAARRRSTRSITSAPVTPREEEKARKGTSAQDIARHRLEVQQRQALKRQVSKLSHNTNEATSLGAFLSKQDDDESVNSDDEDMFSMFSWSVQGSEANPRSTRSLADRSRSVPRMRISDAKSVSSMLASSRDQARSLRSRSSARAVQSSGISSLYGRQNERLQAKPIRKEEMKEIRVVSMAERVYVGDTQVAAIEAVEGKKTTSKRGSDSSKEASPSSRRGSDSSKEGKGSRRGSDSSKEKHHHHHRSSRSKHDGEERSSHHRHKSSRHSKEGDESDHRARKRKEEKERRHRSKSRRRVKEGEEGHRRSKSSRRRKEGEEGHRRRSKSRKKDGKERRRRSKSSRRKRSSDPDAKISGRTLMTECETPNSSEAEGSNHKSRHSDSHSSDSVPRSRRDRVKRSESSKETSRAATVKRLEEAQKANRASLESIRSLVHGMSVPRTNPSSEM